MGTGIIRYIWAAAAAVFALLAVTPVQAQESYSAAQAREDLTVLYRTMQEDHADLYARRSKEDYDAHLASLLGTIDGPVPHRAFHLMLHDLVAFGEVGHAETQVAQRDGLAYVRQGGKIVPLSVTYRDGAMTTDDWAMDSNALPPGSRIERIGSLDMPTFEARARRIISADTPRLLRAQLEQGLPIYLYLIFGPVESLPVAFVRPDGTAAQVDVPAVDFARMREIQSARPVARPAFDPMSRHFEAMDGDVFYLRPGPFLALEAERGEGGNTYDVRAYSRFIDKALAALQESGASNLLIDLRGNPGGDASFSDLLFAHLVDRPYRFASRYVVRAGALTREKWKDRPQGNATLAQQIARGLANAPEGKVFSIDIAPVEPAADPNFTGHVWVLVDRQSYSNTVVMTAMLQDYGFATVMGEETADLPTTYGAAESFTLPNSGAVIHYPKAYMVRPSGDETVRGVVPDVILPPTPIGSATDAMLESALAHIRANG